MDLDLDEIIRRSLPQWNVAEFVFLESDPKWAPSVQAELLLQQTRHRTAAPDGRLASEARRSSSTSDFRCASVKKDRDVLERIQNATLAGVILIVADRFRECLLLLGRLGRLCRPLPSVLVVIPAALESMTPLLLESGASSVYSASVTDIRIAGWCRRVAARNENASPIIRSPR